VKVTKKVRLEDLALEFRLIPERIGEAVSVTLGQPWLEASAKAFCPVDTGALMGSIRTEQRGPYAIALVAGGAGYFNPRTGRPVNYARHVHDGTSRMPARPFLLQAVIMERLRYLHEILRKTGEAI